MTLGYSTSWTMKYGPFKTFLRSVLILKILCNATRRCSAVGPRSRQTIRQDHILRLSRHVIRRLVHFAANRLKLQCGRRHNVWQDQYLRLSGNVILSSAHAAAGKVGLWSMTQINFTASLFKASLVHT